METTKQENEKLTILCIDDEKAILSSLNRLLRRSGYQVFTAESGHKTLETIGENQVDVLISDMRMPLMDGATLLTEIAQNWPETIRILSTGHSELIDSQKAEDETNIHCRIDKPWDDEKLINSIQTNLQNRNS